MEELIAIAKEEDLSEILALQKKAFSIIARIIDRYDIQPLVQTLEETRQEAAEFTVLKYVLDGRIVGTVRGRMLDGGNCYIGKLAVDPDAHNKGIGRKLMQAIESHFADCRGYELFTSTVTPNTHHLYKSLGYEITRIGQGDGVTILHFGKRNNKRRK